MAVGFLTARRGKGVGVDGQREMEEEQRRVGSGELRRLD